MPVKVLGLDKVSRRLKKLQSSLQETEFLERVGRTAVQHIQERTRQGKNADGLPFKPLAEKTKTRRKELAKINKVSSYYGGPAISNLHFSGQLIRALRYLVQSASFFGKARVFVEVTDTDRKPYVLKEEFRENKSGTKAKKVRHKSSSVPTNRELMKYLADAGRKFLGVDEALRRKVRELAVRQIRRAIRRPR